MLRLRPLALERAQQAHGLLFGGTFRLGAQHRTEKGTGVSLFCRGKGFSFALRFLSWGERAVVSRRDGLARGRLTLHGQDP